MSTMWYYASDGEQKGPISQEDLIALIRNRLLALDDLVWTKGLADWVEVVQIPKLAVLVPKSQTQSAQPSSQPSQQPPQSSRQVAVWFYTQNGQQQGPVTAQFLKELAASGKLSREELLWKDGLDDWVKAVTLPGLKFPTPAAKPQSPPSSPQARVTPVPDSREQIVTDFPATDSTLETPDANSIFDIMNDPNLASLPTSSGQKPNVGLASMSPSKKKKKRRSDDDTLTDAEMVENMISAEGFCAIMFFVVACIFVGIALWHHQTYTVRLRNEGITVEGTVIHVDKVKRRRKLIYDDHPTINFTMEDGQQMTVKPGRVDGYAVGDKIEMIYLPDAPERADVNRPSSFSILNFWMIIAIACYFVSAGAAYRWFQGRQNPSTSSWG